MHQIILILAFCAIFFAHNILYLKLTETIFSVKNTKLKMFIFSFGCGVIGTLFLNVFGSMSSLGYAIMLGVYTVTVMLYFKHESKLARTACILTFNIHIMVARAIVSALLSLITGKSILELSQDMLWFWSILIVTSIVSGMLTIVIIKAAPAKYLKALTQKTEQMAAYVAITAVANVHLIANGMVYTAPVEYEYLQLNQIITAITWLCAMYVGMFMLIGFDILKDKKDDLQKDAFYRNLLLNHAVSITEIDCTNNVVLRVFTNGKQVNVPEKLSYTDYVSSQVLERIHPSDVMLIEEFATSKYILEEYAKNNKEFTYNFRLRQADEEYRWLRANVIMNLDESSGCLIAVSAVVDDIHESIMKEKELRENAQIDSLVGMYNKTTTEQLIKEHLKIEEVGALFLIDLDNFKGINDNMGHAYGDEVLKEISKKISNNFRKEDIIGRIGGDEFLVFITSKLPIDSIKNKAQKLCDSIIKTYTAQNGINVTVSCSVGIAIVPEHGASFAELYSSTDKAMYAGKNKGKNTFEIFDEKIHLDYKAKSEKEYTRK